MLADDIISHDLMPFHMTISHDFGTISRDTIKIFTTLSGAHAVAIKLFGNSYQIPVLLPNYLSHDMMWNTVARAD